MPPLPPVPNALRIAIRGVASGRNWANVLHGSYVPPSPVPLALDAYAGEVMAQWVLSLTPFQHPDIHVTEVEVTDLASGGAQSVYPEDNAGTRAGDIIPASAAALMTYVILERYRGGHPRTYLLVGVQADLDDANSWSTDFVTALNTAWTTFTGAIFDYSGVGLTVDTQGCVSYIDAHARRATPLYYEFLEANGPEGELATIRRRVRRAGHKA